MQLSFSDSLYVLNSANGSSKWEATLGYSGEHWHTGLALAESGQYGDSVTMDIITPAVERVNPKELFLYRFDCTGDYERWSLGVDAEHPWFTVGDVDRDGVPEAIVCSDSVITPVLRYGQMQIVGSDGGVDAEISLKGSVIKSPLLVDTDLSVGAEIVAVFRIENLWRTSLGGEYSVRILDSDLNVLREYTFDYDAEHDKPYKGANSMPFALPAVSDIDGDGVSELAYVSRDSVLHVIEIGASSGRDEWPQRYKTAAQSNNFGQPLAGDYEADMTIYEDVNVVGDVWVKGTLKILPGTNVRILDEDLFRGDVDTLSCEIHVYNGDLKAMGTTASPVRFFAWDGVQESTISDDWWGMFIYSNASATFRNCIVKNALQGIRTNAKITIEDCTIEQCDLIGVSIAYVDSVFIRNTTIRDAELVGVNLLLGTVGVLEDCTLEDMPNYGIEVYSGARLIANGSEFRNCDIGIYVQIGDTLTASAEIDSCVIENNDIGIKAYQTSDVTVENCVIDDNTTDGIYCTDDASIKINDNIIKNSAVGIFCEVDSDPVIEENKITNHVTGVKADDDANPDVGHQYPSSGQSSGYNSIHNNTFNLANLTQGGGAPTIAAEKNYWKGRPPGCFPRLGKVIGPVDVDPALCDDPNPSSLYIVKRDPDLPSVYHLSQNYPNPFNPSTTIKYQVPPPGGRVSMVVYNVMGQRVRTLLNREQPPGYHIVTWDGTSDRGVNIASGVYFVRMEAPGFSMTKKLLLLK
jgi:parallel beta-helix repeat protein